MQQQYNADSGAKIGEKPLSGVSSRVTHYNWMLENFPNDAGLGIPFDHFVHTKKTSGEGVFQGHAMICQVPAYLGWEEQAQVGGTHLLLATAEHGVVLLKVSP